MKAQAPPVPGSALFGYRPGAWSEKAYRERLAQTPRRVDVDDLPPSPKVLRCSECSAPFEVLRGMPLTCSVTCSHDRKKRMRATRYSRARLRHANLLGNLDA